MGSDVVQHQGPTKARYLYIVLSIAYKYFQQKENAISIAVATVSAARQQVSARGGMCPLARDSMRPWVNDHTLR